MAKQATITRMPDARIIRADIARLEDATLAALESLGTAEGPAFEAARTLWENGPEPERETGAHRARIELSQRVDPFAAVATEHKSGRFTIQAPIPPRCAKREIPEGWALPETGPGRMLLLLLLAWAEAGAKESADTAARRKGIRENLEAAGCKVLTTKETTGSDASFFGCKAGLAGTAFPLEITRECDRLGATLPTVETVADAKDWKPKAVRPGRLSLELGAHKISLAESAAGARDFPVIMDKHGMIASPKEAGDSGESDEAIAYLSKVHAMRDGLTEDAREANAAILARAENAGAELQKRIDAMRARLEELEGQLA